jgi:hypothetical protein
MRLGLDGSEDGGKLEIARESPSLILILILILILNPDPGSCSPKSLNQKVLSPAPPRRDAPRPPAPRIPPKYSVPSKRTAQL